jgi:hypothetical protein
MLRRRLITCGVAALSASIAGPVRFESRRTEVLSFHVAGARFQNPGSDGVPAAGQALIVARHDWQGEPAYVIACAAGCTLGFVPRFLARRLAGRRIDTAELVRVDAFAVPWKRYRVRLVLAEAQSVAQA